MNAAQDVAGWGAAGSKSTAEVGGELPLREENSRMKLTRYVFTTPNVISWSSNVSVEHRPTQTTTHFTTTKWNLSSNHEAIVSSTPFQDLPSSQDSTIHGL